MRVTEGSSPGTAGQPRVLRTIVRVRSPGSSQARDSAGQQEDLPGKIRGAAGCAPLQRPDPEQLFPITPAERSRSRCPGVMLGYTPNNSSGYPRSQRAAAPIISCGRTYPEHFR